MYKNWLVCVRAIPGRREVCSWGDDIITWLDKDGDLPAARGFEDPGQQVHRVLEDVGWTHVNLGHNHKHGDIESQSKSQVLLSHAHNTSIGTNLRQREGGGGSIPHNILMDTIVDGKKSIHVTSPTHPIKGTSDGPTLQQA